MPGFFKKAPALPISRRQRALLEQIVRRPTSTQQHALRARIILLAGEGIGHQAIADQLQVDRKTVYHWRTRWLRDHDRLLAVEAEEEEVALAQAIRSTRSDAPRLGAPVTYSAEGVCQLIAVACEDPETCRPSDQPLDAQGLTIRTDTPQDRGQYIPPSSGAFFKRRPI